MKLVFKRIVLTSFLAAALVGTAGLTASCAKEPMPGDSEEEVTYEEEPEEDGTVVDFTKFRSKISKGETLEIPIEGEWAILSKGFKKGDVIEITLLADTKVHFELECLSASETEGAVFEIPEEPFLGGMCKVIINASGPKGQKITANSLFVQAVDNGFVEKKPNYTVYGRVVDYEGEPLSGVSVSDGDDVTKTDSQGCYWLRSDKSNPFVFVSTPKGYMAPVNRTVNQFFQKLKYRNGVYEQHNFVFAPEDNTKHRIILYTDTHLANRTSDDIAQFKKFFLPDVEDEIATAKRSRLPIYGIALGDLAWDQFWYTNSYSLKNYRDEISGLQMGIYSTPGNHDNDPNISDDYGAAAGFRDNLGPTYYSVNIGDVHLIMMDNTLFHNRGGDVQDYEQGWTDEQLRWLKNDLKTLPAGSLIIFGLHIQWTSRPNAKGVFSYTMPAKYRDQVNSLLSQHTVHFVSGHTHTNYTNFINGKKMVEHNISGVCGTWWWTGKYTKNKNRLNSDGSPSGYKIFDLNGKTLKWRFQALDRNKDFQFRVYDLAACQMTKTSPFTMPSKITDSVMDEWCNGWNKPQNTSQTKKILINVFDYNTDWTITVKENGTTNRPVTRVECADIFHVTQFNLRKMADGTTNVGTFATGKNAHMFEASLSSANSSVTITATDGQGNTYTETVSRPRTLKVMAEQEW